MLSNKQITLLREISALIQDRAKIEDRKAYRDACKAISTKIVEIEETRIQPLVLWDVMNEAEKGNGPEMIITLANTEPKGPSAEKAFSDALEYLETGKAPDTWSDDPGPHGDVVEYRQDAYHDVKVYEDGYEEFFYIGD